jgi:cytidine deaminase
MTKRKRQQPKDVDKWLFRPPALSSARLDAVQADADRQVKIAQSRVRAVQTAWSKRDTMLLGVFKLMAAKHGPCVETLAFFRRMATNAAKREWRMVQVYAGNPDIVTQCSQCGINVYDFDHPMPAVMPCGVPGCPYENNSAAKPLALDDLGAGAEA